jgi:hypothetical protein
MDLLEGSKRSDGELPFWRGQRPRESQPIFQVKDSIRYQAVHIVDACFAIACDQHSLGLLTFSGLQIKT